MEWRPRSLLVTGEQVEVLAVVVLVVVGVRVKVVVVIVVGRVVGYGGKGDAWWWYR